MIEDYVLFDCPGQVELFTHHESLRNIFFRIQKFGYRVRLSLSIVNSPALIGMLTKFATTASCLTLDGFLFTYSSFAIHLYNPPIAPRYAADGFTAPECSDKNR